MERFGKLLSTQVEYNQEMKPSYLCHFFLCFMLSNGLVFSQNIEKHQSIHPKDTIQLHHSPLKEETYIQQIPFKKSNTNQLKSIPSSAINRNYLELGGGAGIEDFGLLYNINVSTDLYLLRCKNSRISLANRTGLMGGIAPGVIYYTYPSIKFQQNIFNYWLLFNIGREYGRIKSGFDVSDENYQLDFRIDIGLRIYRKANSAIEVYIPIRIGEAFPWYLTGVSMNYYFGIL